MRLFAHFLYFCVLNLFGEITFFCLFCFASADAKQLPEHGGDRGASGGEGLGRAVPQGGGRVPSVDPWGHLGGRPRGNPEGAWGRI